MDIVGISAETSEPLESCWNLMNLVKIHGIWNISRIFPIFGKLWISFLKESTDLPLRRINHIRNLVLLRRNCDRIFGILEESQESYRNLSNLTGMFRISSESLESHQNLCNLIWIFGISSIFIISSEYWESHENIVVIFSESC